MELDAARFGEGVASRRRRMGISVDQLAERAGVTGPHVRKVERGSFGRLGVEIAARLARALGVGVDDLLRDAGWRGAGVSDDVSQVASELGAAQRRAWLRIGRALLEMEAEMEAERRRGHLELLPDEPRAAYDRDREDDPE